MDRGTERKVFGGTNFIIVLWTLMSLFRLVVALEEGMLSVFLQSDFYAFIIPLIFLTVLNVLMGISSFFPQQKNHMWVLSLIIATFTLITLNTFQNKIAEIREAHASQESRFRF